MTEIEKRAVEIVKDLIPNFSKLELRASIGDTSRSVEFFVWLNNNEQKQCYELADNGEIDESKMEILFDNFAKFIRSSDDYKIGEVNKIHVFYKNNQKNRVS